MPTNKTLDMLNIVPLKESINELLRAEGKYAPVATVCKAYIKKLDEGMHEEEICDSFIKALQPVAIHESAKDVLFRIGNDINELLEKFEKWFIKSPYDRNDLRLYKGEIQHAGY